MEHVIFLGSFEGKSKTSGRDFFCYKLAAIELKDDKIVGFVKDIFAKEKIDVSGFSFGDIVIPVFEESGILGGQPQLVDIEKDKDYPANVFEVVL